MAETISVFTDRFDLTPTAKTPTALIQECIAPRLGKARLMLGYYGESQEPQSIRTAAAARREIEAFEMAEKGLETEDPKLFFPLTVLLQQEIARLDKRIAVLQPQMYRKYPSDEAHLEASRTIRNCRKKLETLPQGDERKEVENELNAAMLILVGTERGAINDAYSREFFEREKLITVTEEALPSLTGTEGITVHASSLEDERVDIVDFYGYEE